MNGRNHLLAGAALGADCALLAASAPGAAGGALRAWLSPWAKAGGGVPGAAACAACAGLYLLGALLPDVDNGGLASRLLRVRLPLAHRGWTHSAWAMALFLVPALAWPDGPAWALRFLALGMLCHGLLDGFSTAGWVPFYPLGRHRKYNGTVMARGRHLAVYGSSSPGSEDAFCAVLVLGSAAFWAWAAYRAFSGA